mmetsp:Transcript_16238/g.22673  ORF Transcript_16238/g.22673 Transcript_16238/m.22673 type:complete len:228 (-) Transcript_16238:28-711(-)
MPSIVSRPRRSPFTAKECFASATLGFSVSCCWRGGASRSTGCESFGGAPERGGDSGLGPRGCGMEGFSGCCFFASPGMGRAPGFVITLTFEPGPVVLGCAIFLGRNNGRLAGPGVSRTLFVGVTGSDPDWDGGVLLDIAGDGKVFGPSEGLTGTIGCAGLFPAVPAAAPSLISLFFSAFGTIGFRIFIMRGSPPRIAGSATLGAWALGGALRPAPLPPNPLMPGTAP